MPQHRRKVAFSSKQKKEQLRLKRERRKNSSNEASSSQSNQICNPQKVQEQELPLFDEVEEINASSSRNRYCLKFKKEKPLDPSTKAKLHHTPLQIIPEEDAEINTETFYIDGLDYPKRPHWKHTMSKAQLDQSENKYFRLFCDDLDKKFANSSLSLYELNLETWRQLWRVIEMSDILLIIVDARFAVAQFPPYLYKDLVDEGKKVIIILNKCDLLPTELIIAWQDFFQERYPDLIVLPFSSAKKLKAASAWKVSHKCLFNLIEACETLTGDKADLNKWREKIQTEAEGGDENENAQICGEVTPDLESNILTIGTIGIPNVGKSSFINSVIGKKVVSISKTPGHTKHFQTIFLTKNIRLCDCPGLVFPSICPKELQILIGSYPIAQVRDPVSCIHYIGCRINLPLLLKLNEEYLKEVGCSEWTAFLICEAWAKKQGYFIRTKGGKPDVYRAANELLRFTLVGQKSLLLSFKPPGFTKNKEQYKNDERISHVTSLIPDERSDAIAQESSTEEEIEEDIEGPENTDDKDPAENFSTNRFTMLDCDI